MFGTLSVRRHEAFSTARFDLGNMVQAVWSTAHGHPLRVTDLDGDQVLRLGAHVDPVLVLFAPLWWLWPSPNLLLVVQAIAIALGAVPVYRLARKHLGSSRAGTLFAFAYLLYPPTTWLALNEFHPGGLAMPALLWAIWYLDEDRLALFAVFAVFAACCREDIPLVFVGLGIWYALAHGRRAVGATIAIAGIAWTLLAVEVVIPHVRGSETAFVGRYGEARALRSGDPSALLRLVFDRGGVHYLLDLVLPLAALSLLAPIALAAVPGLALNLLSATPTQTSIHFHYTAAITPLLVAAAVFGAARVRARWRLPVAGIVLAAALVGNYRLGAIPLWRELPGGETLQARDAVVTEHDRIAARALEADPFGRRRQRNELAGRAPLGAAAVPQLSVHRGREVGGRRRDAAGIRGPGLAAAHGRAGRVAAAQSRVAGRLRAGRRARLQARPAAVERSERDRLAQQVRAERKREQCRGLVVLGGGERHGPHDVPDDEVGRREQQRAGRPGRGAPFRATPRGRATRTRGRTRARRARSRASAARRPARTGAAMPSSSRDSRCAPATRTPEPAEP